MIRRKVAATALAVIVLTTSSQAFQVAPKVTSNISRKPSLSRCIHHFNHDVSRPCRVSTSATSSVNLPPPHRHWFYFVRHRLQFRRTLRNFLTVLITSVAIATTTLIVPTGPAHASPSATVSLLQRLPTLPHPFRPRSADQLIDSYVRKRLFADDVFDPVESAYREAVADSASATGYPALLADTVASAMGQKDASSIIKSMTRGTTTWGREGIMGAFLRASNVIQRSLRVSASVSYYILAVGILLGGSVVPGVIGLAYQSFQRLQIDKSEMKMYGKISDLDATAKKESDDEENDEDNE